MKKAILPTLLVLEIVLVVLLRTQGWDSTGGTLRWTASFAAAAIPLIAAAVLLFVGGARFGLRSMLIAVALVALFLFVSVLPFLEASRARRESRRLIAAGAELNPATSFDRFYELLKLAPREEALSDLSMRQNEIPPWLWPLAGDIAKVLPARSIHTVALDSDAEIFALCDSPGSFPNLVDVSIFGAVTARGIERLRTTLPEFNKLSGLFFNAPVSKELIQSLDKIKVLFIWRDGPTASRFKLSPDDLIAIPELPSLQVLLIYGYPIQDADLVALKQSRGLRHLIIRHSAVTETGKRMIEDSLPECRVFVD